jgi:hypothetical protein
MARPRMIIHPVAEMLQWSLDDERGHITGIITNSRSKYYKNGEKHTIMNIKLTSWITDKNKGPYYVARNSMGYYFRLMISERV